VPRPARAAGIVAAFPTSPVLGICAALLLCSIGSFAATDAPGGYLIKNWTTVDGLPENTVRAIVETHDGYLWVGTANGLARFDGVRFTQFNSVNTPGLFCHDIYDLHEDRRGALWISTRRGLIRCEDGNFRMVPLQAGGPPVLFGYFMDDSEGQVWMSGLAGLARWEGGKLELMPLPADGPLGDIHLCARREGGLWMTATNGVWWYHHGKTAKVDLSPLPRLTATGGDGRLWGLVEERRVFTLQGDTWSPVADVGDQNCASIYAAPDGDVWIGAASSNCAFRLRAGRVTEVSGKHGFEGNRAVCFMEDRDGSLWLGTKGAGLYRLRERRLHLFDRNDGLQSLSLTSICQDAEGTIFVNDFGWSMNRFVNNRFEPMAIATDGGPFKLPTAIMPARQGGVWAGTFFGSLARIQNGRVVERIGSPAGTRALFTDRNGDLWRGTRTAGIEYFSGTNLTRYSTKEGLSFDNVYCFAQDRGGAIWVGTEEGLNRIENGRISRFTTANGLGHHFISALCVDSRGTLWAGTLGGGLNAWNGSRFITMSIPEGLPDDDVTQLLEDDHQHLWVGTPAGLMGVALNQLHDFLAGKLFVLTGTLVARNEGLVLPDCWTEYQPASIKARDGRLWFCTGSGVAVIDPRRFATPAPAPMVQVEEVTLDGSREAERRTSKNEVTIPPGRERIEIHYTGLSPSAPELVRFRYRLAGYDRAWVEAGRARLATYSHLRPGQYQFQVKAANNDGVWNESGATLAVTVQPTFWQTTWFGGLMLVLFLGSGPAFYVWRLRRLEKRRAAQESFSRRLMDSQEQERKRIAAELHDSLGQNLLVIKNRAALALAQQGQPAKMVAQVSEVSAMASAALREVREIAQNLRPFQLDELGLAKSIVAMARRLADSSTIDFRIDVEDIDGAMAKEFEINFYRIVQECLNNTVKHSGATTVLVHSRRQAGALRFTVTDNGRGLDTSVVETGGNGGAGLHNIVERARTMGGSVVFHSQAGKGTQVEILVPTK
jgi:signal transduction histidine kinase/ligand-binding sensor domain-containing protein